MTYTVNNDSAVITDTSRSPFALLKPVAIGDVSLADGFWKSRQQINLGITLRSQYALLESTGRMDNFRRAAGKLDKPYQGFVYNDSDVYKWLEAASWTLIYDPGVELRELVEDTIDLIAAAQRKDGYINTYFSLDKANERWTNLQEKHELYCAGHLIQAAVAHYRATGDEKLLNVVIRLADHLNSMFGPNQREATAGHPEIEMALVELYRTTRERKYLDLAALFINRRGHGLLGGSEYLVDHVPLRSMDHLAGHAVRAIYLCSGAADLALETGETQFIEALDRLWTNMVHHQMYVTGGIGSRYEGEAFGAPYVLPNARAYAETCAAIANVMWNWRMLQLEGEARFADLLEWTLYNAVLPGISLDGREYFYVNPLANEGSIRRQPWYPCACCPPNVSRTIAMFPGYMYCVSVEGIWVNLYAGSTAHLPLPEGQRVTLHQETNYPWDGHVMITIEPDPATQPTQDRQSKEGSFSLFLRMPGWVDEHPVRVRINGEAIDYPTHPGTYLEINSAWQSGDLIELDFPMEVHYLESHPFVLENSGRVAVTRGPIVYCLEEVDNPGFPLSQVMIDRSSQPAVEYQPGLLDGVVQLTHTAFVRTIDPGWEGRLYRLSITRARALSTTVAEVKSIPYFAWANRQPGGMQVWTLFA